MCHDRQKPSSPSVDTAASKNSNAVFHNFTLNIEDIFNAKFENPTAHCCTGVRFVAQLDNWDCGLACAAMVLQAVKKSTNHMDPPSLLMLTNTCSTKSIWTIDLAYLLSRYGVQIAVTTIHAGANPAYHDYKFYAPNLAQDIHRVNNLFEKASSLGIKVFKRSVDVTQLKCALCSGRFLIIALVDKAKLCRQDSALCASAKRNNGNAASLDEQRNSSSSDSFTGHFIVLYGYDPITDEVCVQDPAGKPDTRLPIWQLEIARKTYGTDEDLIFIRIPEPAFHKES